MRSLKGHFLVATPELLDPNFHRTVLLMLEHSPEGAAGIVLNRPTRTSLTKLTEEVYGESIEWDQPIHLGGPVPGPLLVLHSETDAADHEIIEGVYSTVDPDQLRELIQRRPDPVLFLANYAGWGAGQLESELAQDSWYTLPATPEMVFAEKDERFWARLVRVYQASRLSQALDLPNPPADPGAN